MKKILFAIMVLAIGTTSADAQTKGKSAKSVNAKNYPICLVGEEYKVCPVHTNAQLGRSEIVNNPEASLRMMDTSVYLGYTNTPSYGIMVPSNRRNPRIRVTIDDPNAPYQGKESMINDGVQKNKVRNINYLDSSVQLPPSDGGLSNR